MGLQEILQQRVTPRKTDSDDEASLVSTSSFHTFDESKNQEPLETSEDESVSEEARQTSYLLFIDAANASRYSQHLATTA